MASDNQLRARVPESHADFVEEIVKERGVRRTEAERVVFREGLASLGYVEQPADSGEVLLSYARKSGNVLGLVGLILIGYGLFGAAPFRYLGFGLILVGFAGISAAEFAPLIHRRLTRDDDEESGESEVVA